MRFAPGIPGLAERERQDAMPRGGYQWLADSGALLVDQGRHMARPGLLIRHLVESGIEPGLMLSDRFIHGAVQDAVAGRWPLIVRKTRWSESTEDIAAFRRLALDGPPRLSIAEESQPLALTALSQTKVESDRQGSARILKFRHGRSRDDVAVAGVLAAGATVRAGASPRPVFHHIPADGGEIRTYGG